MPQFVGFRRSKEHFKGLRRTISVGGHINKELSIQAGDDANGAAGEYGNAREWPQPGWLGRCNPRP